MGGWKIRRPGRGEEPCRRQKQKQQKSLSVTLGVLAVALLMAASLVIQFGGGRGAIPTWAKVYRLFGMQLQTEPQGLADETTVTVLDVGQGDAVLIRQNGANCLIDAGDRDHAETLLATLRAMGVTQLDLLVMTHPHADHIGGMETIINAIPVKQMILPDFTLTAYESTPKNRLMAALENKNIPTTTAQAGDRYPLGDGTLNVLLAGLALDENDAATTEDAVNDTSLCLMFTAGGFSFLDTGDAEKLEEQALAESGELLRCTVFKAGHHGSGTSNTAALLELARPQAVAVSCGLDNDYGHPHQSALNRFDTVGATVYRTDTDGSITFAYTPEGLTVECADNGESQLVPAA